MPDHHYQPTPLTLRVANKIATYRASTGQTIEQAAERFQLSPTTLHALEVAARSPTLDTLDKICAGIGIPVVELLKGGEGGGPGDDERVIMFEQIELLKGLGDRVRRLFEMSKKR